MSITVMCMTGLTTTEKWSYRDKKQKRKNGGRKPPVISTDKNKEMVKDIVLNKSPKTFGYLKNTCWSIRLLATYLSSLLEMNVSPMQTWRIIQDLGIVYKNSQNSNWKKVVIMRKRKER